jgi:hypothetical protein
LLFCASEAYLPTRRGFDTAYGFWSGFIDPVSKETEMNYYANNSGYMFTDNDMHNVAKTETHVDRLLAERAEQIISRHAATTSPQQPLFLYISPFSPHFTVLTGQYSREEVVRVFSTEQYYIGFELLKGTVSQDCE